MMNEEPKTKIIECPHCGGYGYFDLIDCPLGGEPDVTRFPCPKCNGSATIEVEQEPEEK
jgi:hypothetical protein